MYCFPQSSFRLACTAGCVPPSIVLTSLLCCERLKAEPGTAVPRAESWVNRRDHPQGASLTLLGVGELQSEQLHPNSDSTLTTPLT